MKRVFTIIVLLSVLLCMSACGSEEVISYNEYESESSVSTAFYSPDVADHAVANDVSYQVEETTDYSEFKYILNTDSKKVHLPSCYSVSIMSEENKQGSNASKEELISQGYEPCGNCHPFVVIDTAKNETVTTSNSSTTNSQTVYVSNSGKIHSKSNCSGMKNYTTMTYDEAIAAGYTLCQNCY